MKNSLVLRLLMIFVMIPTISYSIQLPRTGQTSCWDTIGNVISCANTTHDGNTLRGVPWPVPRFTNPDKSTPVNGNVVSDQLTGLMWTKSGNISGTTMTWQQALDYVASMNIANGGAGTFGHNDWRLPNRKELLSINNYQEANNANWLNSQGFSNIEPSYYWTSDSYVGYVWGPRNKWMVNQIYGFSKFADATNQYYFIAVRGGQ